MIEVDVRYTLMASLIFYKTKSVLKLQCIAWSVEYTRKDNKVWSSKRHVSVGGYLRRCLKVPSLTKIISFFSFSKSVILRSNLGPLYIRNKKPLAKFTWVMAHQPRSHWINLTAFRCNVKLEEAIKKVSILIR